MDMIDREDDVLVYFDTPEEADAVIKQWYGPVQSADEVRAFLACQQLSEEEIQREIMAAHRRPAIQQSKRRPGKYFVSFAK